MVTIDPTKKHIFIWVPGTGGHAPHPEFVKAVDKICGDDAQILHVKYPAIWDMELSVPKGVEAFKALVNDVRSRVDRETQEVYVGGSSQGSWVISEAYKDPEIRSFAKKTVMFGHPGVADEHDHVYDQDDTILEINHPDDAVTFGWEEDRQKIIESFSRAQRGSILALVRLAWLSVRYPIRLYKLLYLLAIHKGIITWHTSPHDYSQQMPLAVYWLIH